MGAIVDFANSSKRMGRSDRQEVDGLESPSAVFQSFPVFPAATTTVNLPRYKNRTRRIEMKPKSGSDAIDKNEWKGSNPVEQSKNERGWK